MRFNPFSCGGRCTGSANSSKRRRQAKHHQHTPDLNRRQMFSMDSQYEFLSIATLESIYGTPRSTQEFGDARGAHHHTLVMNGVRYHPYSTMFGYSCFPQVTPLDSNDPPVPYDFVFCDEIERELQLWVVNRYRDPPPSIQPAPLPTISSLPEYVQQRICAIEALADEEQVIQPMELLEVLRDELSKPNRGTVISDLSEHDRFVALDYLVISDMMHRLRWKYPRVKTVSSLLESIPKKDEAKHTDGWIHEDCNGIDLWTRTETDGSLSVRCRSVQHQPLFNAISLINEIDLHPLFMPHLAKAIPLHRMTGCGKRAQLLARYIYQLPFPLANRDTVLFAFGCNAINVEGVDGIIISAQSIPSDSTDWWGYPVPSPDKMVRERVRGMSFVMRPLGNDDTELTVISNLDKQVAFIPQSIINWLIKDMIKGLYKNMVKLNMKFHRTPFAQRIADKPEFYDWVKDTLIKHELH